MSTNPDRIKESKAENESSFSRTESAFSRPQAPWWNKSYPIPIGEVLKWLFAGFMIVSVVVGVALNGIENFNNPPAPPQQAHATRKKVREPEVLWPKAILVGNITYTISASTWSDCIYAAGVSQPLQERALHIHVTAWNSAKFTDATLGDFTLSPETKGKVIRPMALAPLDTNYLDPGATIPGGKRISGGMVFDADPNEDYILTPDKAHPEKTFRIPGAWYVFPCPK